MKLYKIETGNFMLDGGAMFGVVPKVLWNNKYPADENNLCNWALRCLLVEIGDRKILINNGIGNKQGEKFLSYYLLNGNDTLEKSLSKNGFSFDDITDVVLTHLHFDHCGGSIKYNDDKTELVPAFKNANFWVGKSQWELALNSNRREKASFLEENILPIRKSGKLKLIEEDTELFLGFLVKLFNGHTDGQLIPFIKYKEKTIVFTSDLLPSSTHIPMSYIMSYDTKPLITLKEKETFLKEAVENNYVLFFEHDFYNECCTVCNSKKGVIVDKTFNLSEIL